jgi:hypothetical protein
MCRSFQQIMCRPYAQLIEGNSKPAHVVKRGLLRVWPQSLGRSLALWARIWCSRLCRRRGAWVDGADRQFNHSHAENLPVDSKGEDVRDWPCCRACLRFQAKFIRRDGTGRYYSPNRRETAFISLTGIAATIDGKARAYSAQLHFVVRDISARGT